MLQEAGSQMGEALMQSCFTVNPERLAESVAMFMTAVQGAVTGYQDKKGTDWMASYEDWLFNTLLTGLEEMDKNGDFQVHIKPVISSTDMENTKRMFSVNNTVAKPNNSIEFSKSINAANNIKANVPTYNYSNELRDISQTLRATRDEIGGVRRDVVGLQTAFAGIQVTLDGASVGKMMTPYINANLGTTYVRDKRRKI